MVGKFTSVVLENGVVPIASSVLQQLGLHPGDQVSISIETLSSPDKRQTSASRYSKLLKEKDQRVLTPEEQAELIALANTEFDTAINTARKLVQKKNPGLFDERGQLRKRKALASLRSSANRENDNRSNSGRSES
jgi:antitoxin component of MazEF toxin-antitoxin module